MKIIIEATSFNQDEFIELLRGSLGNHKLYLFSKYKSWFKQDVSEFRGNVKLLDYADFETYKNLEIHPKPEGFAEFIRSVLDDHQVMMLSDRTSLFKKEGLGNANYTRLLIKITSALYQFLIDEKPDLMYFRITPHNYQEVVLAKAADFLNIPVLVAEFCPIQWRHMLALGWGKKRYYCDFTDSIKGLDVAEEKKLLKRYYETIRSSYSKAIPEYEKERLKKNKGKFVSLKREMLRKANWKRPHLFINKLRCFRKYNELCKIKVPEKKYVVFFLHYQPERTTLPEGFGFAQQIWAIQLLRSQLPEEIVVLVKEHPSTFTNKCDPLQRTPSYYDDINDMHGVSLIDLNVNPFDLMEKAVFTASIAGTIGREALLRGKPVVFFGHYNLKNQYGLHFYKDIDSLNNFIESAVSGFNAGKIYREVIEQLNDKISKSVPGLPANYTFESQKFYDKAYKNVAELKIIIELLEGRVNIPTLPNSEE